MIVKIIKFSRLNFMEASKASYCSKLSRATLTRRLCERNDIDTSVICERSDIDTPSLRAERSNPDRCFVKIRYWIASLRSQRRDIYRHAVIAVERILTPRPCGRNDIDIPSLRAERSNLDRCFVKIRYWINYVSRNNLKRV